MRVTIQRFTFTSDFDSGNMADVQSAHAANTEGNRAAPRFEYGSEMFPYEFNIWTKPDCAGTEFENGNRSWFHFGMAGPSSVYVRLNVVNLNRQTKLFNMGMQPVFRVLPGKQNWERIREKPTFHLHERNTILSYMYRTPENYRATTYFAFTFPYSYLELQAELLSLDERFTKRCQPLNNSIYYHRECLCRSLENRNVDLITITSPDGMGDKREPRLKGLFPAVEVPRPWTFPNKKVVFVSARVHPGETPSSFVLRGFLNFLLDPKEPRSTALRKSYVFKLVPMLNPDGVSVGHYRTDTRGINLNRVYLNPSLHQHPTIHAVRSLLLYYHYRAEVEVSLIYAPPEQEANTSTDKLSIHGSSSGDDVPTEVETEVEEVLEEPDIMCDRCGMFCPRGDFPHCSKYSFDEESHPVNPEEETQVKGALPEEKGEGDGKPWDCVRPETPQQERIEKVRKVEIDESSNLFLYVDLHGHASKRGIFMYGNNFQDTDMQVDCMLLPKLMSLNSPIFDFHACNFSEKNMYSKDKRDGASKEGSGRVAMLKLTNLIHSYTLECNYNTSGCLNTVPMAFESSHNPSPFLHYHYPPKFTPQVFEDVGKCLAYSILDLTGPNSHTRSSAVELRSLVDVRAWLKKYVQSPQFRKNKKTKEQPVATCQPPSPVKSVISDELTVTVSKQNVSKIVSVIDDSTTGEATKPLAIIDPEPDKLTKNCLQAEAGTSEVKPLGSKLATRVPSTIRRRRNQSCNKKSFRTDSDSDSQSSTTLLPRSHVMSPHFFQQFPQHRSVTGKGRFKPVLSSSEGPKVTLASSSLSTSKIAKSTPMHSRCGSIISSGYKGHSSSSIGNGVTGLLWYTSALSPRVKAAHREKASRMPPGTTPTSSGSSLQRKTSRHLAGPGVKAAGEDYGLPRRNASRKSLNRGLSTPLEMKVTKSKTGLAKSSSLKAAPARPKPTSPSESDGSSRKRKGREKPPTFEYGTTEVIAPVKPPLPPLRGKVGKRKKSGRNAC